MKIKKKTMRMLRKTARNRKAVTVKGKKIIYPETVKINVYENENKIAENTYTPNKRKPLNIFAADSKSVI